MENQNNEIKIKDLKIIFFGTGPLAESCIYSLYVNNILPQYIVTQPDKEVGRKQILTPPKIKEWALSKRENGHNIQVLQPSSLKDIAADNPLLQDYDLAIVASYGKIIPENLLKKPRFGFLNVHPSDLPLYRGPSPIESALLDGEKEIVVSIMKLDKEMDHGPILIKNKIILEELDTAQSLELRSGAIGGDMLSNIIKNYVNGHLIPVEQNHDNATYCKMIEKGEGEISLTDNIEQVKNKWRAFYPWPSLFFFVNHNDKNVRIKISKFNLLADTLDVAIEKVIPEGKTEMSFEDFKRGYTI
ncbi:MAG: methionyl-tRNA formyltransferase [Patescibacteria group bacterium]|nr:methionyl-tRNA formyltransferase [Patescibacteria group bacterium]